MLNGVNAFAPIITAAIIAATAVAALIQLRHMRAANHISAMWSVHQMFSDDEYVDAMQYLRNNLQALLEDEPFRAYVTSTTRGHGFTDPPEAYVMATRSATLIGNTIEALGNMIIIGLLDREIFLRGYAWIIDRVWRMLEPYIRLIRKAEGGDGLWEDFEYLTVRSREWIKRHPVSYPRGYGRILPSFESDDAIGGRDGTGPA